MSSEVNQPIRPPSHKSFQLGSVKFSSEFDSGNLSFVEKASSMAVISPAMQYDIWIGTDHPENNYRTWFYFWFEGVGRGSTVTFNVKNMHNQVTMGSIRLDCSRRGWCRFIATRGVPAGGGSLIASTP